MKRQESAYYKDIRKQPSVIGTLIQALLMATLIYEAVVVLIYFYFDWSSGLSIESRLILTSLSVVVSYLLLAIPAFWCGLRLRRKGILWALLVGIFFINQ
jgi:hypothetical protein